MSQGAHLLDAIGFLAGALTISTFAQTAAVSMRITAITANLCFVTYAAMGGFLPILTLHLILLPINAVRLVEALRHSVRGMSLDGNCRNATGHLPRGRSIRAAGLFVSGLALSFIVTLLLVLSPQARSRPLSASVISMLASGSGIRSPR